MALTIIKHLPSAEEIAEQYPITDAHRIPERRAEVNAVLTGTDPRHLFVVGPCSAWPTDAVERYAEKLARLQEEVREHLFLVLRTYIQKPRTTVGWPGPLNQPDPLGTVDITEGIHRCRAMMCEVGQMLPLADEMLFTHNEGHFGPLLSYMALGARSAEDMEHRYIASGEDCAVGVKNPTSGDIETGVNGVLSVQSSHTFGFRGNQVMTDGNPHAHLILRGGKDGGNYDPRSIAKAYKFLTDPKRCIKNPAILVDASHDNSLNGDGKDPTLQENVIRHVLTGILQQRKEYSIVRGFMMESFLKQGKQRISSFMDRGGLSITDPCLGWEETERFIRETADLLENGRNLSSLL